MTSHLGKILVVRGGAIGDFILTLPVLSAFRERFPGVRVELLAYPRVAPLALAAKLVDAAVSIEARPLASFFAKGGPLPGPLAEYFSGFTVILSYLFDPDRIFQENIARCSKAHFLTGPHRPEEQGNLHATEAFLQPLVRLAIFDPDPTPRLALAAGERPPGLCLAPPTASASELSPWREDRWLAVHPGSGSERKNWPEARWAKLVERLAAQTQVRLLIVGGEAEGERLHRLAAELPADRCQVAASRPLTDLAALLGQCWAFVGHDSGISHLAGAVGLQGVVLWGDTRVEVWRPRSPRMSVLREPRGLGELEVETVWQAMRDHFR